MLSIVAGHICSWKGIYTYQLGAIGVEIFLFISGYLYGNREIADRKQWIIARGRRILVPYWILAAFLCLYLAVSGQWEDSLRQLLSSLLNIQGLNYLLPRAGISLHYVGGIGHCWFVTMIMLCYGLTVLVKGSRLEGYIDSHPRTALLLAVLVQIVLAMAGIQSSYVMQYFIGYFYSRSEARIEAQKPQIYVGCTVLMFALMVLRLVANRVIDGTVFYDHVIARLSFNALGVWLYGLVDWTCRHFYTVAAKLTDSGVWKRLDVYSYAVFLVHYMFLKEPFDTEHYFPGEMLQITAMLVLTAISAVVLCYMERCINNLSMRVKQYG